MRRHHFSVKGRRERVRVDEKDESALDKDGKEQSAKVGINIHLSYTRIVYYEIKFTHA